MKSILKLQARKTSILLMFLCALATGFAQNGKGVFIGSLANQMPPHMSAALEVYSNDKGFLIPRMDSVQRLAITPTASDNRASGLMVYDTDNKCVYVWRKGYNVNPTECWFSLCNSDMSLTPGPEGPQGPQGDTGVAGPQGPAGIDGEPGVGLVYQWHNDSLCVRVDTAGAPFTCYWLGYSFAWSVTGDSLIMMNAQDTIIGNLRGPQGLQGTEGPMGPEGPGMVYEWHADSLCVRVDTVGSPFTCYWLGYNYEWSATGDSLIMMNGQDTIVSNLRGPIGPDGPQGPMGPEGHGLIYEWHADSLCVRVDTVGSPFTCYWLGYNYGWSATGDSLIMINAHDTIVGNLRGPIGPDGPQGPMGPEGPGMVYEWHADSLCVRVDTAGSPFTCYWLGYNYAWSATGDSLIMMNAHDTIASNLRGPQGIIGPQGPSGNSVEYYWNGSELCVRVVGDPTYTCMNLGGPIGPQGPAGIDGANGLDGAQGPQGPAGPAGPIGPQGPQGPQGDMGLDGPQGNSIEYYWNGSELCVRVVGDPLFTCVELSGPQGPQGPAGIDGANGLDGAQGPQGPAGPAGPAGPQGIQGPDGIQGEVGPVGCNNANYLIKNDGTIATCTDIIEDNLLNIGIGTNAPATKVDIDGNIALRANTLGQIVSDMNNYDVGLKSFIRLQSDASHNISGLANGNDGQILIITNFGSNDLVLQHQNAGSNASNRFLFSTGGNITLGANHTITLIYDAITGCWRDISFR